MFVREEADFEREEDRKREYAEGQMREESRRRRNMGKPRQTGQDKMGVKLQRGIGSSGPLISHLLSYSQSSWQIV